MGQQIAIATAAVGVLVLLVLFVRDSFRKSELRLRAEEDDHWRQVAAEILAVQPGADVSWCFAPNRPPRRNPSYPPSQNPALGRTPVRSPVELAGSDDDYIAPERGLPPAIDTGD